MPYIQRRLLRPKDCEQVVRHLSRFQDLEPQNLTAALLAQLAQQRAISGLLIEKVVPSAEGMIVDLITVGITGCISIDTAHHYLAQVTDIPLVEYLYQNELKPSDKTISSPESSGNNGLLLRPEQVALANAGEGLAMVALHFSLPSGNPSSSHIQEAVLLAQSSFRLHSGGYHCKMFLHPVPSQPESLGSLLNQGFKELPDNPGALLFNLEQLKSIPYHPFICLQQLAKPQIGFTPSEQDLLTLALLGRNDQEIAEDLSVTYETVRKRWRKVFQRIEDCSNLQLFPTKKEGLTRGPEKRNLVLRYLDANLQEVRPYKF